MDPKNEQFLANGIILHHLEEKFVLEREKEKFSAPFVAQVFCCIARPQTRAVVEEGNCSENSRAVPDAHFAG